MNLRLLVAVVAGAIAVGAMIAAPSVAFGGPSLPAAAKKLSGPEILALYDGSSFKFKDYRSDMPTAGVVTFNLKSGVVSGTADRYGAFLSSIRIDGDKLCGQGGGFEACVSVYTDGTDIYEASAEGRVLYMLQKQ